MGEWSPDGVRNEMKLLLSDFSAYFSERGYAEVRPVNISSRVDKSVDLVGSHISVLKPFIENENVPAGGLHIIQPCIRTRGLSSLTDDEAQPRWGAFFRNLGVLIHPSNAEKLLWDASGYLLDQVGISKEALVLRVSGEDRDLLTYVAMQEATGIRVERDAMPIGYYRHKLGMDGVAGRNFNYSIEHSGEFFDLGNFIIIEKDGRPVAIELGLGNTSIMKAKFGLAHVCLAEPLNLAEALAPDIRPKLYDTVIAATHLLSEGVRPSSTKSCNRTLRTLLRGVVHLVDRGGIAEHELVSAVADYETSYGLNAIASSSIADFLREYGLGRTCGDHK